MTKISEITTTDTNPAITHLLEMEKADGTSVQVALSSILASTTEVLTGADAANAVTPDALAALWEKGADVASAGTVTLGEGGTFHITGTTTITDIDWSVAKNGRLAWLIFDGALTLTHNGTTLLLPGGANITTVANDRALFYQDNSDNVYCLVYQRADGKALVAPSALTSPAITTPTWSGAGSPVISMFLNGSQNISPADSSTYYTGYFNPISSPSLTANIDPYIIPAAGSIFRVDLFFSVNGTLGSAETFTTSVRLNNTTDTTISASCKTDAVLQMFSNSALNITVAAGDTIQIKAVFPAWATNPTTVRFGAYVYLRMT